MTHQGNLQEKHYTQKVPAIHLHIFPFPPKVKLVNNPPHISTAHGCYKTQL